MSVSDSERLEVGDFYITGYIDKGHFGEVYCAKLTKPDDVGVKNRWPEIGHEEVALKKLNKNITKAMRDSEVRATGLVPKGRGLLKHHKAFSDGGITYIVLDYCSGGDVDRRIRRKNITEESARELIIPIILGLRKLHSLELLHRDVKIENFLIKSRGTNETVLGDFGFLTKLEAGDEESDDLVGTHECFAPEMAVQWCLAKGYKSPMPNLRGTNNTKKTESWAVGVSILDILCGGRIFDKANSKDPAVRKMFTNQILVKEIIKKKLEELQLSEQGNLFMYGMLQFDPRHRLSIEKAAGHPWITGQKTDNIIPNPSVVTRRGTSTSTSGQAPLVIRTGKTSEPNQTGQKTGPGTSITSQNKIQERDQKTITPSNPGNPAHKNITGRPKNTTYTPQPTTTTGISRPAVTTGTTRPVVTQSLRVRSTSPGGKKRKSFLSFLGRDADKKELSGDAASKAKATGSGRKDTKVKAKEGKK